MSDGKLKYEGGEIDLAGGVVTTGRASDNSIAFPSDSNVSRYHAEIKERGGEYWLVDLGSSNGTSLNSEKVERDQKLADGDVIMLGGSSKISVELDEEFNEDEAEDNVDAGIGGGMPNVPLGSPGVGGSAFSGLGSGGGSAASAGGGTSAAGGGTGGGSMLLVAGVAGGLALICVVAAGAFYMTRGSSCAAKASISKPEKGEMISQPTDIEVDAEDAECVDHAVFTLDGTEIASVKDQPFTAKLNPNEFPELADGFDHNLQIILVDAKGQLMPQPGSVSLAFETPKVKKPDPTPEVAGTNTQQPTNKKGTAPTIVDIQEMSVRFAKQFPGGTNYNVTNKQFLAAVQKATADYAQDGYYQRASAYRDAINVAYTQEQNLDAGLGFTLAMSRSKFNPAKQGGNEGLWQMSNDFVVSNGYNGSCGTEVLSDQSQNCAAKASAVYMKALVFSVFDGDVIYSAAVFGKSPADAGAWKATLPLNRSDIWNSIRTQPERDAIVKFFAAGIVAENPQKFGLTKDRPLSELYKVTL
ncbi:MAG: FHA domain-containing protein [Acidobacteriota bacterium]